MAEPHEAVLHLVRAFEHLLRAGAAWLEREGERARGDSGWLRGPLARLVEADPRRMRDLRRALACERERWAQRAADDPAAARVHEVFAALCDLLEPPDRAEGTDAEADASPPGAEKDATKFDPNRDAWDTRR